MTYKIKKINRGVERRDYTKVSGDLALPNLIAIQTETFDWFKETGIQEVFDEFFPLSQNDGKNIFTINKWIIGNLNMSINEAKERSKIFDAPILAEASLFVNLEDEEIFLPEGKFDEKKVVIEWITDKYGATGIKLESQNEKTYSFTYQHKTTKKEKFNEEKNKELYGHFFGNELKMNEDDMIIITIKETKEDKIIADVNIIKKGIIFLGDFPMMTDSGTFIINGSQKIVVSQLVRSPGTYFNKTLNRKNGEMIYSADIIPARGTWLEFETETKKNSETNDASLMVRIDKSRKTTATSLLTTLGIKKEEILDIFGNDLILTNSYSQDNLTDNWEFDFENQVREIYKKIKQDEIATTEGATKYIYGLLFDKRKYDLTKAGRFKLNQKLAIKNRILGKTIAEDIVDAKGNVLVAKDTLVVKSNIKEIATALEGKVMVKTINFSAGINGANQVQTLKLYKDNDLKSETVTLVGNISTTTDEFVTVPDILATISYGIELDNGIGEIDDIDHLGNRRVRTTGELLQNQFRIGLARIEKNIKDKLTTNDLFKLKASTVINNKPLTSVIGEFFNLSQLSQFMDQINPLSELTNKRRLTALGPGGLSRERAGLEVRDVHPSHYGRICPIETPEGPNIGLINNLSTYAAVNEYGFITTPYRKVENGLILNDEIVHLTADEEKDFIIAQANVEKDGDTILIPHGEMGIVSRYKGDDYIAAINEIDYIDVSPKQIVSVATSAIPFLEHDDANRALMGANMQRQAVPLINPESPIVGTGIEFEAARDSGSAVVALEDGVVKYVDSTRITVESKNGSKTYTLSNWERSNNGSAIVQSSIVKVGDKVKAGEIIADGPSMDKGELAIGQNVVVAFSTYNGYNFEDAIIMSERVVMEDRFTSVHIDEYTIEIRNTKQGAEEVTSEIPNVSEQAKKFLDEDGIVRIGTEVKVGDILVGKVTPKGQAQQLSPEDKLLQAIFGDKSKHVKDSSLKVPNGGEGIVQAVKRFKVEDGYDDLGADVIEKVIVYIVQKRKIQEGDKMSGRHGNKGIISRILPIEDMPHLEDGTPVDIMLNPQGVPSRMNIGQILEIHLGMAAQKLGLKINTPVFEGLNEEELKDIMAEAGMTNFGKVNLIDGQTGEMIDKPISVGVMYMLKLSHMVDDKLHARNVGPYSLITQQPLGGKAQNGGQRFGEMEVWALEAYGAAHTLREILTIKSDDIKGRSKTYEAIVRSKRLPEPGIPESFNVLTKEIMGLGFDMYMIDDEGNKIAINAYDDIESDDLELDSDYQSNDTFSIGEKMEIEFEEMVIVSDEEINQDFENEVE
ncbi:DNA-directed RNA polymerase subunit beta [Mesoplasma photuris]|nr:DNA-directed RNA polymerase subunit beta [Mesoplasma photuris]